MSKAEIVNYVPLKSEPQESAESRRSSRRNVRDEIEINMRNVYREQNKMKAREIEFSVITPLPKFDATIELD